MGANVEENPRGTRVFKTRVSLLRLEFHFFFIAIFWVRPAFFVKIWRLQSSNILPLHFVFVLRCQIQSSNILPLHFVSVLRRQIVPPSILRHQIYYSSSLLFFKFQVPLFFVIKSIILQVCCSSSSRFVVFQVPKSSIWFCFLELESIRLEIYVASYFQLTKWESSL